MKKLFFLFLLAGAVPLAHSASAIEFPIPELGNCRDTRECWLWCEIPAHKAACWAYQQYGAGAVLGEMTDTAEPTAATQPVFPIAQLGNCGSASACKTYCDVPVNIPACKTYAAGSGLTPKPANFGQETALLAHAKEELGCTSLTQCRAYCSEAANADQCQALAAKYAPAAYKVAHATLFANAQKILGCASSLECRTLCANPVNKDRCQAFAEQHTPARFRTKLRRSEGENAAALPCKTLAECRLYCQDPAHATACDITSTDNKPTLQLQQDATYTCSTKAECERYCQINPDQCPTYKASKDYQRVKLQQQLRGQAAPLSGERAANLERYRRSIAEQEQKRATPSSSPLNPAPAATPAN